MASHNRQPRRVPIRLPSLASGIQYEVVDFATRKCDRYDMAPEYGMPHGSTSTVDGTLVNALGDDLLAEIFSRLPGMSSKITVQAVCRRWYQLYQSPANVSVRASHVSRVGTPPAGVGRPQPAHQQPLQQRLGTPHAHDARGCAR